MAGSQGIVQFLLAKENRVGAIILLVGAIAFLFVSITALNQFVFSSGGDGGRVKYDDQEEQVVDNFRNVSPQAVKAMKQEKAPDKLKYARQKDITESDIKGAWTIETKENRILLQLDAQAYKLIIIPQNKSKGYYSVGRYSLKGDLLKFDPVAYDKQAEVEFPSYRVLTRSSFPVLVGKRNGRLTMQKPTKEMRIYVPPRHPLLQDMPDKVAIFSKLK